ncbi:hypothetical protein O181_059493 [Austropuccinia psidii MF-1]|uniref:Prokaryotic-type class I peptide chain release factors domain-containing protein n=1 Tax=Austropuccinia psidii MF-1 TaxID=1389203 RepID=A0A9Q3EIW7_9BASI|nr:hypothetical protein [Austropuccinia psidii MF-1]
MLNLLKRSSSNVIPRVLNRSSFYSASISKSKIDSITSTHSEQDHQIIRMTRSLLIDFNDNLTSKSSLNNSKLIKNQKLLKSLNSDLNEFDRLSSLAADLTNIYETDPDRDLREIALSELQSIQQPLQYSIQALKRTFIQTLSPTPSSYMQSALIEIKPGVGGVEASHFATSLMSIYKCFATRKKWNLKPVSIDYMTSGLGQEGLREAVLEIEGKGAYGSLRWEAGVHRVQRVPVMQNTAAIHTSTASVIVLPLSSSEADDLEDGLFNEKDVRVDTMRSQGAGGQHVNKTESAVRLTHIPTGIVVSMQDSRSQHQNRARAYMILRARLIDQRNRQKQIEERGLRLSQVKSSNRSEKIRTYNFQQGRVTDHRIGLTLPRLNDILEGGETLELIWDSLEKVEEDEMVENILRNHGLAS